MNKLIQLLTNRDDGYVDPLLKTPGGYGKLHATDEQEIVRRLLHLHVKNTDYYVHGVLVAIDAFPELASEVPLDITTYRSYDFTPPQIQFDSESDSQELAPDKFGSVGIRYHPKSLPAATSFELTYVSDNQGRLQFGDQVYNVGVTRDTTGANMFLFVDWPSETGIRGSPVLDPIEGWHSSIRISADFFPMSYPYAWLSDRLQSTPAATAVLDETQWLKSFVAESDPMRRVGITAVALAQHVDQLNLETS